MPEAPKHLRSAITEGQLLAHPAANTPYGKDPLASRAWMEWRPTLYQAPPQGIVPHIKYRVAKPPTLSPRAPKFRSQPTYPIKRREEPNPAEQKNRRVAPPPMSAAALNSPRSSMSSRKPGFLDFYFDTKPSNDQLQRSATADSLGSRRGSKRTPLGEFANDFVASREMLWYRSSWTTHALPTTEAMKEIPPVASWAGVPMKPPNDEHLARDWASSLLPQRPGSLAALLASR